MREGNLPFTIPVRFSQTLIDAVARAARLESVRRDKTITSSALIREAVARYLEELENEYSKQEENVARAA